MTEPVSHVVSLVNVQDNEAEAVTKVYVTKSALRHDPDALEAGRQRGVGAVSHVLRQCLGQMDLTKYPLCVGIKIHEHEDVDMRVTEIHVVGYIKPYECDTHPEDGL